MRTRFACLVALCCATFASAANLVVPPGVPHLVAAMAQSSIGLAHLDPGDDAYIEIGPDTMDWLSIISSDSGPPLDFPDGGGYFGGRMCNVRWTYNPNTPFNIITATANDHCDNCLNYSTCIHCEERLLDCVWSNYQTMIATMQGCCNVDYGPKKLDCFKDAEQAMHDALLSCQLCDCN